MDVFATQFFQDPAGPADQALFAECNSYIERTQPIVLRWLSCLESLHSSHSTQLAQERQATMTFIRKQRHILAHDAAPVVLEPECQATAMDALVGTWHAEAMQALVRRVMAARRGMGRTMALLRCRVRLDELAIDCGLLARQQQLLMKQIEEHPAQQNAQQRAEVSQVLARVRKSSSAHLQGCRLLLTHRIYNFQLLSYRTKLVQVSELCQEILTQLDSHLSQEQRQELPERPSYEACQLQVYPEVQPLSYERYPLCPPLSLQLLGSYAASEEQLMSQVPAHPSRAAAAKELARRLLLKFESQSGKWFGDLHELQVLLSRVPNGLTCNGKPAYAGSFSYLEQVAAAQGFAIDQYKQLLDDYSRVATLEEGRLLRWHAECLLERIKGLRDELAELVCNTVALIPAGQYPFKEG